jgi:hypothetical protein
MITNIYQPRNCTINRPMRGFLYLTTGDPMLQFKSQADLAQLPPEDPAYEIVKQQIAY